MEETLMINFRTLAILLIIKIINKILLVNKNNKYSNNLNKCNNNNTKIMFKIITK